MKNNEVREQKLISYLYDELSVYGTIALEEALDADPTYAARLAFFSNSLSQLPPMSLEPSPKSVEAVLAYSRATRLEKEATGA